MASKKKEKEQEDIEDKNENPYREYDHELDKWVQLKPAKREKA